MLWRLHATVGAGGGLTSELIHFTTSLLITSVLLVLTLRAARLPGTPVANILFAVCGILWSAGGLGWVLLRSAGFPPDAGQVFTAHAVQYSGAAVFPIAILAVWKPFAALRWQKTAAGALQICAGISAAAIMGLLWWRRLPPGEIARATALNAGIVLVAGAGVILRRRFTPRAVYLPSLAIVAALALATLMMLPRESGGLLQAIASHLILLMVLCTFLLFARFRLADRFIRYARAHPAGGVLGGLPLRGHHRACDLAGGASRGVSFGGPRFHAGAERECLTVFHRVCG